MVLIPDLLVVKAADNPGLGFALSVGGRVGGYVNVSCTAVPGSRARSEAPPSTTNSYVPGSESASVNEPFPSVRATAPGLLVPPGFFLTTTSIPSTDLP